MKSFLNQFNEKITGVISCFDRILFKGYLPLGWPRAMEGLLFRQDILIKDFGKFVQQQSERIKLHAERVARKQGRPFEFISDRRIRKDDDAREIAERDGIDRGLVCVLRALEPRQSFKVMPGEGRLRLVNAGRKCLCQALSGNSKSWPVLNIGRVALAACLPVREQRFPRALMFSSDISYFLVPKLQFGNTYRESSALLAVIIWNSYQHGRGNIINFRRSEAGSFKDGGKEPFAMGRHWTISVSRKIVRHNLFCSGS